MEFEKQQPNYTAAAQRHKRVFVSGHLISRTISRLKLAITLFLRKQRSANVTAYFNLSQTPRPNRDPVSGFLRQTIVVGVALLLVTSILPERVLETGFTAEYFGEDGDILDESISDEGQDFYINEEGFILKQAAETEVASRIGMSDSVTHTVVPGDTLSGIAALYNVSAKTIAWENNFSEDAMLRVGARLIVPPLDGVSHTVTGDKETLSSIAKLYQVDEKVIKEHNKLGDVIVKNQKLFIPGGKKKVAAPSLVARSGTRSGGRSYDTFDSKVVMASGAEPVAGKTLIFPTSGKITQGYKPGHLAHDIGNRAKPDVWAAGNGTVIKVNGGCPEREVQVLRSCGGGYGNYVEVDHGDGLVTLYAHLETIFVSEGQEVEAGQALGSMGNSGRTYGSTGIHLHFEVHKNGVKQNPWNYY